MLLKKTLFGESIIKLLITIKMLFITPFLVRYLGVENYGLYTYILTSAGMLALFFNIGTTDYVLTYYNNVDFSEKKRQMGVVYAVNIFFAILITSLLLIYPNYSYYLFGLDFEYFIFLPFIAFTFIFNNFFTTIAIYQRKLRKFYLFKILEIVMFVVVIFYTIYFQKSFYEFILYYTVMISLNFLILFVYLKEISFVFSFKLSKLKQILSMSIFFMFNGMTLYLLTFIDKFLIQKYMTYYDLGIYGLSVTIIGSILVLTATFLHIIIKIKINENIKSEEKLSQIRFFSDNLINILIVPILMGFAIYGYNFLILYAGDNFSQSYQYTVILLIVVYFNLITYFYSQKYFLQNKQKAIKIMFKITVFVLIINIILNIITIPRYGLMGATFSSVIASLLQCLAIIYITKSFSLFVNIIKYLIPVSIVWGAGYYLWDDDYGFWLMWVYCIISMLIYWLLVYIFYKSDIKKLIQIMRLIND